MTSITDPIEAWALRGNAAVDEIAGRAYDHYPKIMSLRETLKTEVSKLEKFKSVLHKTLINIGNLAMDLIKKQRKGTHNVEVGGNYTTECRSMQEWLWPEISERIARPFQLETWSVISTWVNTLHVSDEKVQFWSWGQLVVDFGIQTKLVAPWYCRSSKRWKTAHTCPRSPISKRCRWFKTFVAKIFDQIQHKLPMDTQKPDSYALHFWCHCLPVKVPEARSRLVDEWFLARRSTYLKSSDLQTIWDVP